MQRLATHPLTPATHPQDLDKLERMVFELMSTGRTRDLYSVLKVRCARIGCVCASGHSAV